LRSYRLAPESVDLVAMLDRAKVEISHLPQAVQMQAAAIPVSTSLDISLFNEQDIKLKNQFK
jgi:hypothetical protein